jgi:hypothetical protein
MVIKKAILIFFILLAVCAMAYATALSVSPLPMVYIDRDRSGLVSIKEAINANYIGQRETKDHPGCFEYFWLKDGLTAYINCPDNNKKTRVIKIDRGNKE